MRCNGYWRGSKALYERESWMLIVTIMFLYLCINFYMCIQSYVQLFNLKLFFPSFFLIGLAIDDRTGSALKTTN